MENILELHKNDIEYASEILGRAFQNDPLVSYLFPDAAKRSRRSKFLFRFLLRLGMKFGHCFVTSEDMEGLIIAFPSTAPYGGLMSQISCGIIGTTFKIGLGTAMRALSYDDYSQLTHKNIIKEEHYYLHTLGVDPDYQGKGHSSALMKYLNQKLNSRNLPVYLETSNEENVAIYEHFGFSLQKETVVPGSDDKVKMWIMVK